MYVYNILYAHVHVLVSIQNSTFIINIVALTLKASVAPEGQNIDRERSWSRGYFKQSDRTDAAQVTLT